MSDAQSRIGEMFDGPAITPTEDEMIGVITAQASPSEQISIITGVLSDIHLVETFGELWDELCPESAGLNPETTLGHLLRLARARESTFVDDIKDLVSDPESPTWLQNEARAYSHWRVRQGMQRKKSKQEIKDQ